MSACKPCRKLHGFNVGSQLCNRHYETILPDQMEFGLAFTIKIYTNPEQADQLLRAIHKPHSVYFIYGDKKAETNVFNLMKKIGNCLLWINVLILCILVST